MCLTSSVGIILNQLAKKVVFLTHVDDGKQENGVGVRRRAVKEFAVLEHVACIGSADCDVSTKPTSEANCYAGIPCQMDSKIPSRDWDERSYLDGGNNFGSIDPVNQSPRLITGEWSSCSATCGTGVASRTLECVAMHPISGASIKLPMAECQDEAQPELFQPCEVKSCPMKEDSKTSVDTSPFQWQHGEWSQCSATCLGGKQKAALKCVEMSTGKSVQWSQCDARRRPPEKTKVCNQHSCPPYWQIGRFSDCSTSCGGGVSTRSVRCAQTVSKSGGADAQIILRDEKCLAKKPVESEVCNAVACPPTWVTGEWNECSKTCDAGERRRRVSCEVRDGSGRIERRSDGACDILTKPLTTEMCSLGSCGDREQLYTNRIFEQNHEQKKLTLGIGGMATLYQGTSIKIKCPAKKFDKKKVYWTKNGKRIRNDAHIKVSTNGNLRVFHARMEDAGIYECYTDKLQGNVTLSFKFRDYQENQKPVRLDKGTRRGKGKKIKVSKEQPTMSTTANATLLESLLRAGSDQDAIEQLKRFGDQLIARWDIGHWTECRQKTCHVTGYEARAVFCQVTYNGETRNVDQSICESLATTRPAETRPCHRMDCPRWEASPWTECSAHKCVSNYRAQQKRNVTCNFINGTLTEMTSCDVTTRPMTIIECEHHDCRAEWKTSDWGSCSSDCGTGGVQLRLLSCIWNSSKRPAGRNCEQLRRPHTARACVAEEPLPPCHATALPLYQRDESCDDNSRFCDIIKLFHSCDSVEVRQKCCATCNYVERRRKIRKAQ